MVLLSHIARLIGRVANLVVGWLLLATVVINVAQVFTRYVMNDPLFWTEEAIRYLTVWFTFVGCAAVSHADEHMDMNLFADVKSPLFQAFHKTLLHAINMAFGVILAWQGYRYTMLSGMQTAPTTGLPMLYVYSAIAIGGVMLVIISLDKIARVLLPRMPRPDAT
jgi:TRAP-type C4-dicarboxylate transport system permease small subunit